MPEGGQLRINTSNVTITAENQHLEINVPPGGYVKLSVHDTGSGISPNIKDKIFEPFFSTKGNKGTGLGLATVYGIITEHNGTIFISSEPTKGTDISIYLPVSEDNSMPEIIDTSEHTELKGDETILLVEDNKQVLKMTETILKQKGYSVFTADNDEQGLNIVHDHDTLIHLLVTDVVMPKMNGKDLFINAKKIKPDLRVLYMSGYDDDVISHQGMLEEDTNFIQKPFSVSALCIKIREILDS